MDILKQLTFLLTWQHAVSRDLIPASPHISARAKQKISSTRSRIAVSTYIQDCIVYYVHTSSQQIKDEISPPEEPCDEVSIVHAQRMHNLRSSSGKDRMKNRWCGLGAEEFGKIAAEQLANSPKRHSAHRAFTGLL